MKRFVTTWLLLLMAHTSHALPPDNEYVIVGPGGQLQRNGERVRYWAVIGGLYNTPAITPSDSPEQRAEKIRVARRGTDRLIQHYADMGFNACRFWDVAPGADEFKTDAMDYFIAQMKARGFKIWMAGLNRVGQATANDVDVVADPATAAAWAEAVGTEGMDLRNNVARVWDARLEALALRRMEAIATHTNRHTGLRWCDDPVFAVWELSNEEWWMSRMVRGAWQKLPAFFKNQLAARWNEWLGKKYGSDEKLAAAWGKLLPGESLARGTVLLAPMAKPSPAALSINDAGAHAQAALAALDQQYGREDFHRQRGADVLEFFLELQLAHKQREAAAVKSWGKSTRLSPLVWDTGIGYEIQSQYLHQHAEAVAHDAYVNGWGVVVPPEEIAKATTPLMKLQKQIEAERLAPNAGPWINWLLKPPGISQGVPWLEHNRVEGKPFFCYETQIQQPAKYRADFPLRLAALASVQDWDFVCWHYFGPVHDAGTNPRPFDKPLDVTTGKHPQGYHFTFDEVQNAMMRAAGWIWRQQLLAPAARPTKFIFGRHSLYDPATMDYAGSYGLTGLDMLQTVYQHGVRIAIDPTREHDEVIGPVVSVGDRHTHNPYTPTGQIVFDWKKGYLAFDAPGAVAFTGLLARYGDRVEFQNGVTLRDVTIHNPPGLYDPVGDDERYIAFALHALDGQSLATCRRASLSVVSTSFNSGFQMGERRVGGTWPVLVARVGATIEAPALDGMQYTQRDWHMNPIRTGVVRAGQLTIAADQPVFVIELTRQ